jgi:GLPGLI family protein
MHFLLCTFNLVKNIVFTSVTFVISVVVLAQEQKIISDCTITYLINSSNNTNQTNIGSETIYIKGKNIRVDLVSNTFTQTIFYNSNTGEATVLKTVGESKYISQYNADEWKKENSMYDGIKIFFTGDTKKILNYNCKQAILTLKNGTTYEIYYVPDLLPSVMKRPFEIKNIPGLVLEYESSVKPNGKLLYTAQKIDFAPVPSFQFDIPKTGYRILH